ncbi:MAG: hypothetical protein AB8E15_07430 [Bdellovibrionales bacterium]
MDLQTFDFFFPFFVFLYGVMVSIPLCSEKLMKIAEERLPTNLLEQFKAHRVLALVCVYIGGLWSLQNIVV